MRYDRGTYTSEGYRAARRKPVTLDWEPIIGTLITCAIILAVIIMIVQ